MGIEEFFDNIISVKMTEGGELKFTPVRHDIANVLMHATK